MCVCVSKRRVVVEEVVGQGVEGVPPTCQYHHFLFVKDVSLSNSGINGNLRRSKGNYGEDKPLIRRRS